jgi:hypothetical protein
MRGRIKRPFTVVAAATLALLLAAPGAALAKGPGGGGGTGGGGSGSGGGTGGGGTGGGGGGGGTTSKGTIFGDLIVVLRDANGVPILNDQQCVQPISYTPVGDAQAADPADYTEPAMYDYGQPVYLLPLVGGTDLTIACDIQTGYTGVAVEFGRLSVGRSPDRVLAKQLADVSTLLATDTSLTLDASGRIVVNDAALDSPLQNLAIYQQLLEQGTLTGATLPIGGLDFMELAAAAFAAASDKTAVQTIDTVQYVNRILKIATDTKVLDLAPVPNGLSEKYVSFADFNYNRSVMFPGCITYWDLSSGSPVKTGPDKIVDVVFPNQTQDVDLTNAKAFASMVDDARQVLLFVHDQVEILVDPIGTDASCLTE